MRVPRRLTVMDRLERAARPRPPAVVATPLPGGPEGPEGKEGKEGAEGKQGKEGAAGVATMADFKESVRVCTTANVTIATALNSGDAIDGVTLANGDRVLVANQTTKSQNGIYVVSAEPARSTDADAAGELSGGTLVYVEEGTTYGDRLMRITTNGSITPGTTAHDWSPLVPRITFGVAEIEWGGGSIISKALVINHGLSISAGVEPRVVANCVDSGRSVGITAVSTTTFTAQLQTLQGDQPANGTKQKIYWQAMV